ncbi:hypothetical protein ASPWEDRAFT_38709 [Aspergillus wentii DTO 134E9]|uniref:Uncharacterized protein n=1 Tax=Aspergillus wentii DTO 134E9 TaxID=1073089 RepID=A0A1L9RQ32_ASPWE|nr:uncharacterized protein ASPWEDRAFT_38709 [Aspergillus wentii DTO 134E9]OJJ37066.1 hypothetical protein ASPWEDRAFT_38709 [Aspergillus wentii DTO 134E9]
MTQTMIMRYMDDHRLASLLKALFPSQPCRVQKKNGHIIVEAPRTLTKEELESCVCGI